PRPSPTTKRSAISIASAVDRAEAPVATPELSRVRANTERRPMRSASCPPRLAPLVMPAQPAEAIREPSPLVMPQWTLSAAITKEIRPTSIASSAQPSPETTSSFPCLRVNGRRSRRCERVTDGSAAPPAGACRSAGSAAPPAGASPSAGPAGPAGSAGAGVMVTSTTTREYGLYGAPPHSDRCPERDQNGARTGSGREGHQVHVGFAAQHRQSPSRAGRAPGGEHFSLRLVHQTPAVELLALQHDRLLELGARHHPGVEEEVHAHGGSARRPGRHPVGRQHSPHLDVQPQFLVQLALGALTGVLTGVHGTARQQPVVAVV